MKAADIRAGGRLALARRWGADWGPPQWDRPFDPNYTTISSTGKASLEFRFERVEAWHPWDRVLYVRVTRGRLLPGDSLTIVMATARGAAPEPEPRRSLRRLRVKAFGSIHRGPEAGSRLAQRRLRSSGARFLGW